MRKLEEMLWDSPGGKKGVGNPAEFTVFFFFHFFFPSSRRRSVSFETIDRSLKMGGGGNRNKERWGGKSTKQKGKGGGRGFDTTRI